MGDFFCDDAAELAFGAVGVLFRFEFGLAALGELGTGVAGFWGVEVGLGLVLFVELF